MHVVVTRIPRFLPVLLAFTLCVHGEAPPLSHVLFDATFKQQSGDWMAPGARLDNGQLVLACTSDKLYDGVQLVFTRALSVPPAGEGCLRLRFTVDGARSPAGGYLARFFLLPNRLNPYKWTDSYGMPHALTLCLEGDEARATLSLYARNGAEATGLGQLLFSGGLTSKSFPLPVDLHVDRENFRIQFGDAEVATEKGARSGRHNLAAAIWQGEAGFGARLINATQGNKPEMRLTGASAAIELATTLAPASAGAGTAPGRKPVTAVVQVYPEVVRAVGGYDQVQALFGGNVNGESLGKADDLFRELNLNTCRLHMWPDIFGAVGSNRSPVSLSFATQFGVWGDRKPLPADQIGPAWDRWFRQDFSAFVDPILSNGVRRATDLMEYQLTLQKNWHETNNIVFFASNRFDSNAVRHPDDTARYFDDYLNAVAKYAPWVHTTFAQLSNEPNYGWFTDSFAKDEDPVAGWISLFNAVDGHLRQTHPDQRLLGPCLASCAFFSWGGWQTWTVPVLKGVTRDMEDFNYHNYSTAAQSHLAWVEMLQAQAEALGRKPPRAVVTEMNDEADCNKAGRKFEWWSEQFFTGLNHPDKFHLWSYFLLASRGGGAGNVISMVNDVAATTDAYWLFWVLRQTRGTMRAVEPVSVPDLYAFACTPQDDRLVISLFNNTGAPAKLTVRSGLPAGAKIQGLQRWSAHRQADLVWHTDETLDPRADVETELPPGAVQSLVWTLAAPAPKAAGRVEETEFFAPKVNATFRSSLATMIAVPRLPREDETVALRFAVASDDLLAARGLAVVCNGATQTVAWTEAPREEERGPRSLWWMELPLPRAQITRQNVVTFANADASYRLMFASLIYQQHPTPELARRAEAQALEQRCAGLVASVAPLGALLAGESKELALTLENRRDQPARCTLGLDVPAGLTVSGVPAATPVELPAHGRQEIRGQVQAGPVEKIQLLRLMLNVQEPDGSSRSYPAAVTLYPKRNAAHLTKPPVLDGKLDDWPETEEMTAPGNAGVRLRAGWDADNLYLAADVKTGRRPVPPANVDHFWESDCMEVFLDVRNSKSALYEDGDGQFFFCPYSLGQDGVLRNGYFPRVRKGDQVVHGKALDAGPWQAAVAPRDDGYVLECKLPWSVLATNFTPRAGAQIGMDVAIHGCESLFGAEGKPYDTPRLWGVLTLK